MIKKTFTYENFAGENVTRDFYFHLSKADFVELALGGDWEERMRKAIKDQDRQVIYQEFKRLISMAIGQRSENGEDFHKPEAFRDAFMNSGAFDELITELFTSEDMGTNFIKGCLPSSMQTDLQKELDKVAAGKTEGPFTDVPDWVTSNRVPTAEEFNAASEDHKKLAFQRQLQQKS